MKTFTPMGARVFVKAQEGPRVTEGGIHLPDNAKKDTKITFGEVLEVGSECGKDMITCIVGEVIAFSEYSASKVKIGADEFFVVKEEDILGILA